MSEKAKAKRLSKSERTHQRRLKQAARKPGGAAALQLARAQRAGEVKKTAQPPVNVPKQQAAE